MNRILFCVAISFLVFVACNTDDATEYEYTTRIHSPSADDKNVGDRISISVDFESLNSEAIHHINVRVYNKSDNTEVYNAPTTAHIHELDGTYEWRDEFILSNENGVEAHTDWILEAKVWGHKAGQGEVIESVEFHVHP